MSMSRLPLCANRINEKHSNFTLLDVGCRTMDLKPLLSSCSEYHGTDLIPVEGVLKCDLEKPLPFKDNEFDIVTALDVLEHLNSPHDAFGELLRIARKAVYISLPNMYYIKFRLNYLRGHLSGKYSFSATPIQDRHRWILSYGEAQRFIQQNSKNYEIYCDKILPTRGRTKFVSEPIEKWLSSRWPDLFAYGSFFEISKNK